MVQAAFVLDNVDDSNKCSSRTEKISPHILNQTQDYPKLFLLKHADKRIRKKTNQLKSLALLVLMSQKWN